MTPSLENRSAVITGASRGLGKVTAAALAEKGARLLLIGRDIAALQAARADMDNTASIELLQMDVSHSSLCNIIPPAWHDADVLINNAGVQGPIGASWDNDWQEWQDCLAVNLLAPVAMCRFYVPAMKAKGYGKIVNLSGGGSTGPRPGFSAYATAKTALVRFSENLAKELEGTGVDVNCVAPGAMPTEMLKEIIRKGPVISGQREYDLAIKTQMDGAGTMERAAALCAYLSSEASDGVTGKLISAVWDPWEDFSKHIADLNGGDIYTLRRIVPADRGKTWGDK